MMDRFQTVFCRGPWFPPWNLEYDGPLSKFAFTFNLRRCIEALREANVAAARGVRGRAVQVEPMKPMLKPPGTDRLKPECDEPLSNFTFKFNMRR
jgi:hypothetical protein